MPKRFIAAFVRVKMHNMKLLTFEVKTVLGRFSRLGILLGERHVVDANAAWAWLLAEDGEPEPQRLAGVIAPPDMRRFIEMGDRALDAAREVQARFTELIADGEVPTGLNGATLVFELADVRLKTPLPNPNMLRDFLAFEEHSQYSYKKRGKPFPNEWYEFPVYYKGNPRTLIGHEEPLLWPSYTERLDYELELVCVLGRHGRDIPAERADDYIFGYSIMDDFSARDIQMKEMRCRLGPAKGKDFATAIGPWIVTKDEIGDVRNLRMTAKINGELWSDGNSGTSHYTFEQMIAHLSMGEPVFPGDILGSGTVGRGCGMELERYLSPGDTVELEIENIGILRNQVVKG